MPFWINLKQMEAR